MDYRILVTGSRHAGAESAHIVVEQLNLAVFMAGILTPVIVHGACPHGGVDWVADAWGHVQGYRVERHAAEPYGRWPQCGPIRNSHMVSLGASLCLAFPGPNSRGTKDCAEKAINANIWTWFKKVPK